MGTLSFGTRKKRHFNDEELALMQAVADQVAVAMERRQFEKDLLDLQEKARAKAEELQAVLDAVPIPIFMSRAPQRPHRSGKPRGLQTDAAALGR